MQKMTTPSDTAMPTHAQVKYRFSDGRSEIDLGKLVQPNTTNAWFGLPSDSDQAQARHRNARPPIDDRAPSFHQ